MLQLYGQSLVDGVQQFIKIAAVGLEGAARDDPGLFLLTGPDADSEAVCACATAGGE